MTWVTHISSSTLAWFALTAAGAEMTAAARTFDIAEQSLSQALLDFSKQSGALIVAPHDLVGKKRAPAVRGTMSVREALEKLLMGTDLTASEAPDGSITIRRAIDAAQADSQAQRADRGAPAWHSDVLEEIVITGRYVPIVSRAGTKMDTPLLETPQSISVITREQVELLRWQNIEESLRYTSGVTTGAFGADARYDWIAVRGFSPTTYLDGMKLASNPVSFLQHRLELQGVESVEVLKGPSSTLYGQAPPGGLVNVTSRRPRKERTGNLSTQLGNYDSYQGVLDLTGAVNADQTLYYALTALYRDNGTQVDFTGDERFLLAPSLTWEPLDRLNLTLLARVQYDDSGTSGQFLPLQGTLLPNPFGEIPTRRYVSDPNFDDFKRDEHLIGHVADFDISDNVRLHHAARYANLDISYEQIGGAELLPDFRTLNRYTFTVEAQQETLTSDTRIQIDLGGGGVRHKVLVGIDYVREDGREARGSGGGPPLDLYDPVYA